MTEKTLAAIEQAMASSAQSSQTLTREAHTCTLKSIEDLKGGNSPQTMLSTLLCTLVEMQMLMEGQTQLLLRSILLALLDPVEKDQEVELDITRFQ